MVPNRNPLFLCVSKDYYIIRISKKNGNILFWCHNK
nr:MAG TPA: hypothetical protein [Caudoviricetes sp.]